MRGLDYYNGTVFEIVSKDLGAQDALLGGGRYDGLISELGGPEVPGLGFAIGEDRLIDVLPEATRERFAEPAPIVVVPVGDVSPEAALGLAQELRDAGVACLAELSARSMKAALKAADRRGARDVLLLGEQELEQGQVTWKNFASGEQTSLSRDELIARLLAASNSQDQNEND